MDAKELGNQPAYPWVDEKWQGGMPSDIYFGSAGLTKREVAAIAAMQGILSNPQKDGDPGHVAVWAVRYADAMLAELAKGE